MQARKYYGKLAELKGLNIELSVSEAQRVRSALFQLRGVDLGSYGSILEILRDSIPQQWEEEE